MADLDAAEPTRRAPFGANRHIGARGQRTRRRILDAALGVFNEVGYAQGSVDRIAKEAGCSRASFYQYFADKDELLANLTAQLVLQLDAAVTWLPAITADEQGWASLREFVERWARIHERHRSIFSVYPTRFDTDPQFAEDATAVRTRLAASVAATVEGATLPSSRVTPTVDLLLAGAARVFQDVAVLRASAPDSYPVPAVLDACTDAIHRSLFGLLPDVNVHVHDLPEPPELAFGPLVQSGLVPPGDDGSAVPETRQQVVAAAKACFAELGFHSTRIDTIAERAGVSHGTLYTYFDSKEQLVQVLALDAMRAAADALRKMPEVGSGGTDQVALRRWLEQYNLAQAGGTAMIQVWSESLRDRDDRTAENAPPLEWGRRRIAQRLAPRGFGDVDLDAALLLSFISQIGARRRDDATLDVAAAIIDRAFFGSHPGG